MVDGIRKPSRNPRSRTSAAGKPESRDVKTGMLMGVGSRKGSYLGVGRFREAHCVLGCPFLLQEVQVWSKMPLGWRQPFAELKR